RSTRDWSSDVCSSDLFHAFGDGCRADDPDPADYCRALAPGDRGRLARIRGATALARRGPDECGADSALGHAVFAADYDPRRIREIGRASCRDTRGGWG